MLQRGRCQLRAGIFQEPPAAPREASPYGPRCPREVVERILLGYVEVIDPWRDPPPSPRSRRPWGRISVGVCARLRAGCTILSLHPILPSWTVRNGADLGGNLPKTAPSRLPHLRLPLTAALGSPCPAHHPQVPRTIPQVGPGAGVPTCGTPGAARLLHLPGEAARAHLSGLWPRLLPAVLQHPPCPRLRAALLPRVPQDLQAEGPPGPGGEDEAPATEAAAHRAAGAQASSRPGALTSHWDVTEGGGVRGDAPQPGSSGSPVSGPRRPAQ